MNPGGPQYGDSKLHTPSMIRLISISLWNVGHCNYSHCGLNCVHVLLQEKRRPISRETRHAGTWSDDVRSGSYVQDKVPAAKVCELQHLFPIHGHFISTA